MTTDFRFDWQDTQAGDRLKAAEDLANSRKPSGASVFAAAVENSSLTNRLIEMASNGGDQFDPNFVMTPDTVKGLAEKYQLPQEYWNKLSDAGSAQHAERIAQSIQQHLSAKQTLAQAGWMGTAADMLVNVADPVSIASMFTPAGVAGWMKKGGAVSGAIKTGLIAGGTNAALQAGLTATDPTSDPREVMAAGMMGLAIGTPIGALAGRLARTAHDGFVEAVLRKAKEDGHVLSPEGEARLSTSVVPYRNPETEIVPKVLEGEYIPAGSERTPGAMPPMLERPAIEGQVAPEAPQLPEQKLLTDKDAADRKLADEGIDVMTPPRILTDLTSQPTPAPTAGTLEAAQEAYHAAEAAARDAYFRSGRKAPEGWPSISAEVTGDSQGLAWDMENPREWQKRADALKAQADIWRASANEAQSAATARAIAKDEGAHPGENFGVGDKVTWTTKDGTTETGTIHKVLDNGQYVIKDANGNIRATREAPKSADDPGQWMGGSIGAGTKVLIEGAPTALQYLKIGPWKFSLRLDTFNYFQKDGNPFMKFLGSRLLEDEVGKVTERGANGERIFSANNMSAEALANIEYKRYESWAHGAATEQFAKWRERVGLPLKDRWTGEKTFYESVTKILRGDEALAREMPEAAAAAREISSVNATVLEKLKAAGVAGAEHVVENQHYVMRKFDFDKLGLMLADGETRGRVHQLITEAILKVRPELAADFAAGGKKAETIAKHFVKKLREIPTDRTQLGFLTDGGRGRLQELLRQGGVLDADEVEHILDWVYGMQPQQAAKEGTSPRLKYRTFMDENHSITWADEAGKQNSLSISDLLVNDIRVLNRAYYKQTSGLIGLAKVGFRSRKEVEDVLEQARQHYLDNGVKGDDVNTKLEDMRAMVRAITGQPIYEGFGSRWEKGLRIIKNFNYVTYMAQGAFAQATEYGQVLAQKTIMAARTNMGAVDEVLRTAERGTLDKQLAKDLIAMGAVAEETPLRAHVWTESAYDGLDRTLSRMDNVAAQGATWVSKFSGMAPLTDFQRMQLAKLYTQRLLNLATGAEKVNDSLLKRLATNGLEGDELEAVFNRIKQYATVDSNGSLLSIDYARWEADSSRTYDLFRLAVYREAHRGIQELSLGGAPIWMHKNLAKIFMQFRSFVLSAYTKQLLYGLNHFDPQTVANWTFTTVFGGLAYAAQTSLNYAGDQKKLDQMLTPGQIALAAFNKAGYSSIIPSVVDTASGLLTGQQYFAHGRSTGLGTGLVAGNPTISTLNKLGTAVSGVAQSALTSDHVWTQNDVRQTLGLLPNYYGIRSFVNNFAQDFPTHNYLRPPQNGR